MDTFYVQKRSKMNKHILCSLKNLKNDQKWPRNGQKWPKMAQKTAFVGTFLYFNAKTAENGKQKQS